MAVYTVKDNESGRTVKFEWHNAEPPTDTDMQEVFAAAGEQAPAPAGQPEPRFPTDHPMVQNEDGTSSNVKLGTFSFDTPDGPIHTAIPTMVNGKQLSEDEAVAVARQHGLDKYPTFKTAEEAEAWVQKNHGNVATPEEPGFIDRAIGIAKNIPLTPIGALRNAGKAATAAVDMMPSRERLDMREMLPMRQGMGMVADKLTEWEGKHGTTEVPFQDVADPNVAAHMATGTIGFLPQVQDMVTESVKGAFGLRDEQPDGQSLTEFFGEWVHPYAEMLKGNFTPIATKVMYNTWEAAMDATIVYGGLKAIKNGAKKGINAADAAKKKTRFAEESQEILERVDAKALSNKQAYSELEKVAHKNGIDFETFQRTYEEMQAMRENIGAEPKQLPPKPGYAEGEGFIMEEPSVTIRRPKQPDPVPEPPVVERVVRRGRGKETVPLEPGERITPEGTRVIPLDKNIDTVGSTPKLGTEATTIKHTPREHRLTELAQESVTLPKQKHMRTLEEVFRDQRGSLPKMGKTPEQIKRAEQVKRLKNAAKGKKPRSETGKLNQKWEEPTVVAGVVEEPRSPKRAPGLTKHQAAALRTMKPEALRKRAIGLKDKKAMNSHTIKRLKEHAGITNWKDATPDQLATFVEEGSRIRKGDRFLTDKQLEGMEYLLEGEENPGIITQREFRKRHAEREEVYQGVMASRVPTSMVPTVDIKKGNKVVTHVVDKADFELRAADRRIESTGRILNDLMKEAEHKNMRTGNRRQVGENIFRKMGGEDVPLTKGEEAVVDYLTEYFEAARKDLDLKKYRKNYITHVDKTFMEKLADNGWNVAKTLKDMGTKDVNLPIDTMLALDDIIGSKKFFRFALERKGKGSPSTNIRKILRDYSRLLENKKALDRVLPEGQAAVQLLLEKQTAQWLKRFMQNLKGRGLDYNARQGRGKWAMKIGDRIVDLGYIRLLGANYKSSIKNIIGGEANSLVYQTFDKYLTGKKRFLANPVKSHKIISDMGLLDGSYIDLVKPEFVQRGKKAVNTALYGFMQAAEYEIRGSYMLGELTKAEWKAGKVTPERFRKILDDIAITQGIYTKVDSPLFAQTTLGRSAMQFSRWKITNANLARRISKEARKEWKRGEYLGKNTRSLLKMATVFGVGTYLTTELAKGGYKEGAKYAAAGTELVNIFRTMPGEVLKAATENPVISTLDAVWYSMENLFAYLGLMEEPRKIKYRQGVEDLYWAAGNIFPDDDEDDTE